MIVFTSNACVHKLDCVYRILIIKKQFMILLIKIQLTALILAELL